MNRSIFYKKSTGLVLSKTQNLRASPKLGQETLNLNFADAHCNNNKLFLTSRPLSEQYGSV